MKHPVSNPTELKKLSEERNVRKVTFFALENLFAINTYKAFLAIEKHIFGFTNPINSQLFKFIL